MPQHARIVRRVLTLNGRRSASLVAAAVLLAAFPAAAAPRTLATGPAATKVGASGKHRWRGALSASERVADTLGSPSGSSPAPSFRVIDLGTLGGSVSQTIGPYTGEAWDVNNSGTVVGRAIKPGGAYRPFIFYRGDSAMTEMTSVPGTLSWALGVGNSDKVVGSYSSGSTRHAFLWSSGTVTELGNLSGDLSQDWAAANNVNNGGLIVGDDLSPAGSGEKGFYYDGAMHEIGPLVLDGFTLPFCHGIDINDAGLVVGNCHSFGWARAVRYDPASGTVSDLGSLVAGENTASSSVNGVGQIDGTSGAEEVVWQGGTVFDLGPRLGDTGGVDISDNGAIVANQGSGAAQRGLILTGGQLYVLNDLIDPTSGYTILEAHGINNIGEVAARAFAPNGEQHAVLLTPNASVPIGQTFGNNWARNPTHEWAEPVDSATGAYSTSVTDLSLPGIGVPFTMARRYVSANGTVGILGRGWSTSLTTSLAIDPSTGDVLLKGDDGQQVAYVKRPDGSFAGAPGAEGTLTLSGGIYELIRNDQTHYRFDSLGNLITIRDRNGQGMSLNYTNSQLSSVTDSVGRQINLTYNNGLLASVSLPDGRSVQYGYTNGLLTSVIDARGGTTNYEYDAGNRLSKIIDQNQHTIVHNVYGADGRVTDQYDARDDHSTFGWDPATQTATFTDARGKTWTDVYKSNVLAQSSDPLGHTTKYEYDVNVNLTAVTDPRQNKTSFTYDDRGNVLTRKAPAPLSYLERWTYDSFNNVKTYTDGRGNTTTYGYDAAGNLTSTTGADPDGTGPLTAPVTTITRDPAGTGLVTAIQDPRLKTTHYGYDPQGNLGSVQTPLGNTTTMHYDGSGRMDYLVEPRGNVQGADPNQYKWLYGYNEFNELHTQADPLGHTTTLDYFPDGALETRTDANGHASSYAYWPSGELQTLTAPDPDGNGPLAAPLTNYAYDATGNLQTRTDANQHVTTYGYDDAGRLVSRQTQLGKLWTYGYDNAGNLTSVVDANGNATQTSGDGTTTFGYDNLNRLTSITYSDAPTTPNVGFTYDEDGDRKTMTDGQGSVSYNYDNLERLTSVARGSNTFSYSYDADGNITQRTYPDTTAVAYAYDDDGRLQTVATSGVGTTSYSYDAAADLTTATLPSANGYIETQAYDRAGRLTEVKDTKGASTLADFVQTLDPVGNPLTVARTGSISSTTTYGYDNLDRLTSVCFQATCPNTTDPKITWTYDGVGNRLTETRSSSSTSYSYDGDDRLSRTGLTPGVNPYSTQVQVDGGQPYWRLGETSGSTFASAVGSYDGTWTGSPTLGVAGALNGDANKAVTLNGTSQYGTVTNSTQLGKTNNFSLELWVKRSKNATSQAIVGKPLTATTKSENYAFWFDTTNKIRFEVGAGNKSATVTSAAALDANWHHVVGTFASGALKLYVDGTLSASATASFTTATTNSSTLDIGRAGTTSYYGGSIDEVALYSTALTAAQVSDHRSKGVTAPPATTTTTYSYDNDGRETSAGPSSFSWNLADRLSAATVLGANVTYSYDGDGNRANATSGAVTTNEVWDIAHTLPQLALERDSSNNLIRRYIVGDSVISMTTAAGNYFYHHDLTGSISSLTDGSGGTQWTYTQEPFGTITTSTKNSGSAPFNPLHFIAEYVDPSTGLLNLRARQYDTGNGRFLSSDPLAPSAVGGADSPYPYAEDRPTVLTDPSGQTTLGVCVHVGLTLFHIHGSASSCLVASASELGGTVTLGGGASSAGFGGSANVGGQYSNGRCIRDLGGWFTNGGGSAFGSGADVFQGRGATRETVTGGDVSTGIGVEDEVHVYRTDTHTGTFFGSCSEPDNGRNSKQQ